MYIKHSVRTLNLRTGSRILKTLALSVFLVAGAKGTYAVQYAYVATTGADSNPCTVALPCRTLQGAHNKADHKGEVVVLDTGNFGKKLVVTKAITISGSPGVKAGLATPPNQTAVTVSAAATDVVVLRNLYLDGGGSAPRGIYFESGAELHVEGCVVSRFDGEGIYLDASNARAFINDTTVRNNVDGILVSTSGLFNETDSVVINRCRAEGNSSRGFFISSSKATIRDSVAAGNETGFYCYTGVMSITGSMATNNHTGVFIESISSYNGTARIAYSTVTGNRYGLYRSGVAPNFYSMGNNFVHGNGANAVGPILVIPAI